MSSVKDTETDKTVNIEGILADFFLNKMNGSKSESWSYEKKRKKSKKHKSKKSKHKRSRSHSSEEKSKNYLKCEIDHSSSEEKDIKRLQRLKRLDIKDNLNVSGVIASVASGDSDSKIKLESSKQSDIPYGPSLETLLGISTNMSNDKNNAEVNNASNDKINAEADIAINNEINIEENIVNNVEIKSNEDLKDSFSLNKSEVNAKIDDKNSDSKQIISKEFSDSIGTRHFANVQDSVSEKEKNKEKSDKYSRSRSRSRSVGSEKRSRSHKNRSDKHRSRSRSKSKSHRDKKSRNRSRSRSYSHHRKSHRSRSRSKEYDRRYKRYPRSRSRSKRRGRSRSRSNSRKRTESRLHKRYRSSSRSRHSVDRNSRYKSKSYKKRGSSSEHDLSRRKRSHSKSNDASRRKRSRSKSNDVSRRKRSRSKSNDVSRRKRSRSWSNDASRKKRSRSKSNDTNRRKRSRSKSNDSDQKKQSHSKSSDKRRGSNSMKIDQAKILEIAQKNVLSMIEKGTLPEGLSLDNFKKEQLLSLKAGGKSVQELTDFCAKLSKKENDPVAEDKDDAGSNAESGFIHHPFKLKEVSAIKLNIKNSVQIPVKTHAEKVAETARLSSQFPVSSGNKHKQKELEWIPVEPVTKPQKDTDATKALVPLSQPAKAVPIVPKQEIPVASDTVLPPEPATPAVLPPVPLPPSETPVPLLPPPPPPPPLPPPLPPSGLLSTPVTVPSQPQVTLVDYPMIPTNTYSYGYPVTSEINSFYTQVQYPNVVPAVEQSSVCPVTASHSIQTPSYPKKPIDVSAIVAQRFKALTKLQTNPNDIEALQSLEEAQSSINDWVQSQEVPGLFTGSTGAKLLSVEELSGPRHWNYRAKKDIFTRAAPVTEGKGMSLLKKMGWNPGEGLGKNKEGSLEPLVLDIKTDKKGLVSEGEGSKKLVSSVVKDLQGKHPVSALMELCSKRKWKPPLYTLIQESGPSHKKLFLFKVEVNNVEYQPATPTSNKKVAKADAAVICLQALSVFPKS